MEWNREIRVSTESWPWKRKKSAGDQTPNLSITGTALPLSCPHSQYATERRKWLLGSVRCFKAVSIIIWSCTVNMPYLSSFDHAQSTCRTCHHLIMHIQHATVSSSWGDPVQLIQNWIQLLTKGDGGISCWNLSSIPVLFVLPAVIWRLGVLHWMVGGRETD